MGEISPGMQTFIALVGIWLILAVIGNVLVIIVVYRDKKMRTVTNLFICNLALSDIFLAAFVLPQNIHDFSHPKDYHEGLLACKLVNMLPVFCITCSVYSLVAMSCERLQGIVNYTKTQLSRRSAKIISVSIWLMAVVLSIPTGFEYGVYKLWLNKTDPVTAGFEPDYDYNYTTSTITFPSITTPNDVAVTTAEEETDPPYILECGSTMPFAYSLTNGTAILLISYLIPMSVMLINYSRIGYYIVKKAAEISAKPGGTFYMAKHKHKIRIVKMLVIVAVLFVLCWLPYFSLLMTQKVTGNDGTTNAAGIVNMLRVTFAVFSTSYNAVLYVIYNSQFRKGFKELLCSCKNKKNKVDIAVLTTTQGRARSMCKTYFPPELIQSSSH